MPLRKNRRSYRCRDCKSAFKKRENFALHQRNCSKRPKFISSPTVSSQISDVSEPANSSREEPNAAVENCASSIIISPYDEARARTKFALHAAVSAARETHCAIETALLSKLQKETADVVLQQILHKEKSMKAVKRKHYFLTSMKKLALQLVNSASEQEKLAVMSVDLFIREQQVNIASAVKAMNQEHIVFVETAKALLQKEIVGNMNSEHQMKEEINDMNYEPQIKQEVESE